MASSVQAIASDPAAQQALQQLLPQDQQGPTPVTCTVADESEDGTLTVKFTNNGTETYKGGSAQIEYTLSAVAGGSGTRFFTLSQDLVPGGFLNVLIPNWTAGEAGCGVNLVGA